MKITRFISILAIINLLAGYLSAQEFYTSLNNYNRILLNPSYAGFDYESNVSTSWAVFVKSKDEVFNEYSLVYDCYSPKLKAGTAFFLKQGLQSSSNVNTLEAGFSFTPHINQFKKKLFAFNISGVPKTSKTMVCLRLRQLEEQL